MNYSVRKIDRLLRFDTTTDNVVASLLPFAETPNALFEVHKISVGDGHTVTIQVALGSPDFLLPDGSYRIVLTDASPSATIRIPADGASPAFVTIPGTGGATGPPGTGGGTTPPLSPGDPAAAPNIISATVQVYYEGSNFGFQGNLLLPVADPKYANLKRIDIVGTYPTGHARLLGTIVQWATGIVSYKVLVGPQPTAHQDWVVTVPVYNINGTVTTGATVANPNPIGVDPIATSTVTASEVGPRSQDKDRNLHTIISVKPNLVPPTFPQDVTIWLQYGDGVDVWQDVRTMTQAGQEFLFGEGSIANRTTQTGHAPSIKLIDRQAGTIFVPINVNYGLWTVKAAAGNHNNGVDPASVGAVSSTFTVTPVGACLANGITDAKFLPSPAALTDLSPDLTIIYTLYHPGLWLWAYYAIEFTTPNFVTDNNYWESELTVQKGYTQTGTGTVTGGTTLTATAAAELFAPEQAGFEIHVAGVLTSIASYVSGTVVTLAAAQPNGPGKPFDVWNPAPDGEGVDEDPFLHYRGRRFFSSPQIQDVADTAIQVITTKGADPATWKIPPEYEEDDVTPYLFQEFRIRLYNVSRQGTDKSGSGGAATHMLQNVAWGGKDHGTLIPVSPGDRVSARHLNPNSLADALHGGGGQKLKVAVAPPLYIDIGTNSAAIGISGDFVVGSDGKLTQKVIDLAKSINFGNNPSGAPFFSTNGNTIFTINAVGVNYLIAGDALFTGDVTFARTGGGKVTINNSGIRLDDNVTTPTTTVFVTSAGFQAAQGNNKLIANATGIQIQTSIGTPTPYVNTLTMDSSSLQLFSAANSVVINTTGITVQAGSYATVVTANKVELTGPGGHRVTTTSNGVTVYADALHYVEVLTSGVNIVGGTFTVPSITVTTSTCTVSIESVNGFSAVGNGITVKINNVTQSSAVWGWQCYVTATSAYPVLIRPGQIAIWDLISGGHTRLDVSADVTNTTIALTNGVGGGSYKVCSLATDTGLQIYNSGLTVIGKFDITGKVTAVSFTAGTSSLDTSTLTVNTRQIVDSLGNINGTSLFVSGQVSCNSLAVTTFSPGSVSTGSVSCTSLNTNGGNLNCGLFGASSNGAFTGTLTSGDFTSSGTVNCVTIQTNGVTRISSAGLAVFTSLRIGSGAGTERIDSNGVYKGSVQWNDHVYAADFGIMPGGVAGPGGALGVSGSFTTGAGKTITVWGGIITAIV